jgi:putative ABC transport system permease protein
VASALFQAASGDYFETMGIPLLRGRVFDAQDIEGRTQVAIIDETMAKEFWPDADPIGRRVAFEFVGDGDSPEPIWREVVGVVGHVRHYELKSQSRVQLYVPFTQPPIWFDRRPPLALFVRTQQDPTRIVSAIRAELTQLDPNLPLYETQTMDAVMSQEMATDRMFSGLLVIFSAVALVLAAVGLYGIIAYTVARRTHEIGIRMALGAGRSDVLRLVMRRAVALTAIGIAIGLAAAFAVTRMLGSLLFEIDPHDPLTFGGIAALLAVIALAASYVPAFRATRVDPVVALRYE